MKKKKLKKLKKLLNKMNELIQNDSKNENKPLRKFMKNPYDFKGKYKTN